MSRGNLNIFEVKVYADADLESCKDCGDLLFGIKLP